MPQRPNLLVMMSDQHSKHLLGCYGNSIVDTPNLDRLAREGMRFTDAYCPAPLCLPSRMSFMTSRRPSRTRCWNNEHILSSAIPTWAHALGGAGYRTALIGRMHFMGPDQRHGFEERPIGEFVARHPGAPFKGGPRWVHFSGQTSGQDRVAIETVGVGYTHYHWFDERVGETACAWLRERARDERDTRPFAAAVGFVLPHCPFIAPRDLYEKYYDKVDIPEMEEAHPPTMSRYRQIRRLTDPHPELTAEQVRRARAAYFALVELFDRHIGRILSALDDTGLAENTLVVYTSDHGELAGEHGCWTKSCYYEGSVGVPLIVRLPGAIEPGSVSGAVCNLMDIGPTLADAAGSPFEHDTDGRSLWPTMTGHHPADWADETTSEFVDIRHRRLPSRMIRSGPWKLWAFGDEDNLPAALYNMEEDPGEMHDRSGDPSCAAIEAELLRKVHDGWDPARAARESEAQEADRAVIDSWGRAALPDHEDTLPVPPPEIEAGVEIF